MSSIQQYLFLFTIASVQSFISQARKTRDLYAGSRIISELIDAAMDAVAGENPANLFVFPVKESPAKPNRFLAKIVTDDIQKFGEGIDTACRIKWIQLAAKVFQRNGLCQNSPSIDEKLIPLLSRQACSELISKISNDAVRQIVEFPDIYWAATKYDGDTDDYEIKYGELSSFLGGIKNVRKFCQLDESEGSRRCAIDGERTALFYRNSVDSNGESQKLNFLSSESRQVEKMLDFGEALSAVSLVKRLHLAGKEFPSTAEIALLHLIDKNWKTVYEKCFGGENVDFQLFYEENLTQNNLKKQGITINHRYDLENVRFEIQNLTKEPQTKYYALLLFDGDDFGKLWSGKMLANGVSLEKFQQSLAQKLHEYAEKAKTCLDKSKGKTVYTGGDDFLGFVNLQYLFSVLSDLQTQFDEIISQPMSKYLKQESLLTFSAGVVIAHYKAPLGEVLGKARMIEKKAKNIPGKNAYGIAVMKHSGKIHEGFLPFCFGENLSEQGKSLSLLQKIIERRQDEKGFSNTFIKSFEREVRKVMDKKGNALIFSGVIEIELKRLLRRSLKQSADNKENIINEFYSDIKTLKQISGTTENFLSLLNICEFISRQTHSIK